MQKFVWSLLSVLLFFLYAYFFPATTGSVDPAPLGIQADATEQTAVVARGAPVDTQAELSRDDVADLYVYTVTRVVDGDTLEVQLGTTTEKVRLLGIDTPELRDKREVVRCFADVAKQKTTELVSGKQVRLEADDTQDDRDRYRRLLRYVYVGDVLVNRELVAQGYAYEYTYRVPYRYQQEFKSLQMEAKEQKMGLWADTCKKI